MLFDIERIQKSARRIIKFVQQNARRPGPDAVHDFRTSTRSLEAAFSTLGLSSGRKRTRMLSNLKELRGAAGQVRDMDVLIADALIVLHAGEQDCLVQLIEYLGYKRSRRAQKLRRLIGGFGNDFERDLKRGFRQLKKTLKQAEENPRNSKVMPRTTAKLRRLSRQLSSPSPLDRKNLHSYRIRVKELRNVLQISSQTGNAPLVAKLGEVKDAIGDWHDWEELVRMAAKVVDHESCELKDKLKATADSKYEAALQRTHQLQDTFFKGANAREWTERVLLAPLSKPAPVI